MALLDPEILIDDYTESDAKSIQALELACSQALASDFPFKYVKFARLYHHPYHSRVQMFPKSFTYVARLKGTKQVIGLVSGAVKQAYYDTEIVNVGYIFDLRVHDTYLRRGVGLTLVKKTEKRLVDMGAKLLYGILFAANVKAEMMFEGNLGYKIATKKTIHIESIDGKEKAGEFDLEDVDREEAAKSMAKAFTDRDLMLRDVGELLGREEYLGTVCVKDKEGNKAEVSLWDATVHTSRAITEIYYPADLIVTSSFYVPFFLCTVSVFLFGFLTSLYVYDLIPANVLRLLFGSIVLLIAVFAAEFLLVFIKYWRVCVKQPKGERKLLLFGHHFVGNPDIKEVLYEDLLLGVKARYKGRADAVSWFVDNSDPDAMLFNSSVHQLVYVQKKVGALMWNAWTRSLFSDPRELV